jgi:hypothetical protein
MIFSGKSSVKQNVPLARVHSKTAPTAGTSALRGLSAASLKQQNRTAKVLFPADSFSKCKIKVMQGFAVSNSVNVEEMLTRSKGFVRFFF